MSAANDDAERIRRDIERTQAELSTNVNAFAERVSPGRIVGRRVDQVRAVVGRARDTVMGVDPGESAHRTAQHLTDTASKAASHVSDGVSHVSDGVSSVAHTVGETPDVVRHQARGNPIAAGVVAFGVGWLVSSMLPASSRERRLAERVQDQAAQFTQPVFDAAKQAADEVKQDLAEPARQAVDTLRSTAVDGGRIVGEAARTATAEVQDQATDAAATLKRAAAG